MAVGPFQVHAQQHFSPVLRLGTAGAGLYIDIGIVGIHRAREHAAEFQLFETQHRLVEIGEGFGQERGIIVAVGQRDQFAAIGKLGLQFDYGLDDAFQFRPFLAQRLRMLGLVPDIGFAQFAFYFG